MKYLLLIFTFILFNQVLSAQTDAEYNIKGDQALLNRDYLEARMWYGEGIETCDKYSILQLTELWKTQPSMRLGMRVLMSKCFNCLEKQALLGDTGGMIMLSEYYKEGIGVEADSIKADNWNRIAFGIPFSKSNDESLATEIEPVEVLPTVVDTSEVEQKEKATKKTSVPFYKKMDFFAAYTFSPTMPLGVTIGGISKSSKIGAYLNFKTNFKSLSDSLDCNNQDVLNYNRDSYYWFDKGVEKWNNKMFTAGIIYPIIDNTYISFGVGYGKRDLYWSITEYNYLKEKPMSSLWCHNVEASYKGFAMELGGIYNYKKLLFLGGCSTIAFKDLDFYIGLGYSF